MYEPPHEKTNNLHMGKQKADQLPGNHEADHRLSFRYTDTIFFFLNPKFQESSLLL